MIEMIKTTNRQLFIDSIRVAYELDNEIILYHNKPSNDLEEMIQETYTEIGILRGELGADLYIVKYNNVTIGYSSICLKFSGVNSFGINVKYRNEKIMQDWLENIQNLIFENSGHVNFLLNTKNKRDIDFLIKNGYNGIGRQRRFSLDFDIFAKYKNYIK